MKALRGTPETNPRVPPAPSLEVPFELRSHLPVGSEARVEQRFDRIDGASEVDVRGIGGFSAEETSLSLRRGKKFGHVAERDLESVSAQTTSLVHRLVLIFAGEQRHCRVDAEGLF